MVNTDYLIDDLKELIVDRLETKYTEFAVGTDDTTEDSGDTDLGNQVFTDSIDSVETTSDSVLYKSHLLTGEANGNTLREFGLKDGSGNLGYRKTFSGIAKTVDIDIWFELEESVDI